MAAAPNQLARELAYLKMLQGITGAGGSGAAQGLGGAGSALGIYGGLEQGTPMGDARAALSAGKLGNQLGAFGDASGAVGNALGAGTGALGIYSGLQQGGVGGDLSAALSAAQLYGNAAPLLGASASGGALGTAGSGAMGLGGTGVLGAASTAALPLALFMAQYGIFNKQSQVSPEDMARTATEDDVKGPNGQMTTRASLMPYNQPGEPWQPAGYNPQAIGQAQAQSDQALANSYRTGQYLNPITGHEVAWDPNSNGPPQWQPNTTGVPYNMRPSGGNPYIHPAARGGSMNLHDLYKGSFQRFQDGGSAGYEMYANYDASPPASSAPPDQLNYYTPYGAGSQLNYQDPNTGQVVSPAANQSGGYAMNPGGMTINPGSFTGPSASGLQGISPTMGGSGGVPGLNLNIPGALGLPGSLGQSGLGSLWNGLNTGQQLGTLGGLLAGIGAATNNGQNLAQQYHPAPPPMFANTGPQGTAQNTSTGPNPYGNFSATPRQQVTPSNVDWAHIGEGPMPSFFQPGTPAATPAATPASPAAPPSTAAPPSALSALTGLQNASGGGGAMPPGGVGLGGGGMQPMGGDLSGVVVATPFFPQQPYTNLQSLAAPSAAPTAAPSPVAPPMMTAQPYNPATPHFYGGRLPVDTRAQGGSPHRGLQGLLDGPGDGTSDDIVPAALSAGEYVVPAHVVSALGNGDNKSGARRLDAMQKNVRVSAGRAMAKNQHPTGKNRAKQPESYMRGAE